MLPLGLLSAAQGHPMLVELKNGETLNGHLVQCDTWMNLTLKEVVQTNADGDSFMRIPEVYVKGNNEIKYLRVPDEIIDTVKEQQQQQQQQHQQHHSNYQSGGFRGRGGGGYQRGGDGQGGRGAGAGAHRGGERGERGDRGGRGGSRGGANRGRGRGQ